MKVKIIYRPNEEDYERLASVIRDFADNEDLCKADKKSKPLEYKALQQSKNRAQKHVERIRKVMVKQINAVLAEVK